MNTPSLKSAPSSTKQQRIDLGLILAGLVALFVILPLSKPGLPPTADTPIHFYRTLEFAQSWESGVLYPRWAAHLAYGYGYPLWNFAPPVPYLIPLIFQTLGAGLETAFKLMIYLAVLGYSLGAYLFVKQSLGSKAGLVAAVIYTLAPFALREAILYGGNYPQYMAIGLYPWLLWGFERLNRNQSWGNIVITALLYGLLILCHLFHALIITPVAIAYVIVIWFGAKRNIRKLIAPAMALLLGLLWTAFFWLPALLERDITRATEQTFLSISPVFSRFLNWAELLAWPQALDASAANPWIPFSLGLGTTLLAVAGIFALIQLALKKEAYQCWIRGLFFLVLLLGCLFMMLPVSTWLWINLPLLGVAEFPWRMLGLANLSLAFLGGASVLLVRNLSEAKQRLFIIGAMGLVIISSAVYLYPPGPFIHYEPSIAAMSRYELTTQAIGTTTLGEYLPLWVEEIPKTSPLVDQLSQNKYLNKFDATGLPANASVRPLNLSALNNTFLIDSPTPFQARFFTFYFLGWQASINGELTKIEIEEKTGLITLAVPAGEHTVALQFTDTPFHKGVNWFSLLIILGLTGFWIWQFAKNRKDESPSTPTNKSGLSQQTFLVLGAGLVALLLLKALFVDPYTNWFRQQSPPGTVSNAQHLKGANLDNKISLLGYDIAQETISAGESLRVVLYWQAQEALDTSYRSFAHLDSPLNEGTISGSDNFHPGDSTAQIDIPTVTWDTAHYVRDEHFIDIPPDLPPVTLNLRVGMYNPATGQRLPVNNNQSDAVLLQTVQIEAGKKLSHNDIPNVIEHYLGEHIQLLGYSWDEETGKLHLYWQSDAPLNEDYVVFVQLLNSAGNLAWGFDSPPLNGLYPTSSWEVDYPFAETRQVDMSNLKPGQYTLLVGMYEPQTLQRLGEVTLFNINVD